MTKDNKYPLMEEAAKGKLKSLYIPPDTHTRLMDYQETVRKATGTRPPLRGCIGLLLDREQLYRERLKRLGKMAFDKAGCYQHDSPYAIAADIMAGEGE